MEFGAAFILVVLLIVLVVLGGGVFLIAARLRARKLDPEGDKVEGSATAEPRARPEHLEVENEQRTHFVGSR